jgi:hypothetical protein
LFLKKTVVGDCRRLFYFTRVDETLMLRAQQELFIAENGFGIPKSLFIAET